MTQQQLLLQNTPLSCHWASVGLQSQHPYPAVHCCSHQHSVCAGAEHSEGTQGAGRRAGGWRLEHLHGTSWGEALLALASGAAAEVRRANSHKEIAARAKCCRRQQFRGLSLAHRATVQMLRLGKHAGNCRNHV